MRNAVKYKLLICHYRLYFSTIDMFHGQWGNKRRPPRLEEHNIGKSGEGGDSNPALIRHKDVLWGH